MMWKLFTTYPALTGQKNKAFTLVETLVAISIFTGSILGLMSVLTQGITNTNYAKRKIVASYLAQEGIEYIRNFRDTYVLYSSTSAIGWNTFNSRLTTGSCGTANGCYFDDSGVVYGNPTLPMTNLSLTACSGVGGACPELKYDSTTGKYAYASGANSGYIRKIIMTTVSANETKISSTVSWIQGSGSYSIVFSENLFNWVE